jgi:predicted secreted Zn-dependent protease
MSLGAPLEQRMERPHVPVGVMSACVLALAAGCASTPSLDVGRIPPDVGVVATIRFYPVSAATLQQLRAEMRTVGPVAGGRRWPGTTHTRVRWTFRYLRRGTGCALQNVRVRVTAEIRLPRWEPEEAPDSATLAWWQEFNARLLEHERGHVRVAVDGAREIAETLRRLEGGVSCDGLGMRANDAAQLILFRLRQRQVEYDLDTRHGARQPTDSVARPR